MNNETQQNQNEEAMNYKKMLYALIEDIDDPSILEKIIVFANRISKWRLDK